MPTMQGTDAWEPRPERCRRRLRALVPRDGPDAAWQDADVGVRLQRVGRASAAGPGAQSVGPRAHRGCVIVGLRRRSSPPAWCRSHTPTTAADRSEFRRPATVWSDSSLRVAGCRWTRNCARCRCASSPTASSAARCATPRRSIARPSGYIATRRLPAIGDVIGPGAQRLRIAVCTQSICAGGQSGGTRADAEDCRAAGGAWATRSL